MLVSYLADVSNSANFAFYNGALLYCKHLDVVNKELYEGTSKGAKGTLDF